MNRVNRRAGPGDAAGPGSEAEVGGFAVVCEARSGSGYLCSALDSHPALACHDELFNPALAVRRYGVGPFQRSGQPNPRRYIEAVQRHTQACSGARRVGFKLHFRHDPAVLELLLGDPRQRIILLHRRDKLAQWASYRLARVTGQWARPKDDDGLHPVERVPFKLRPFCLFLVHQRGWERQVLRSRPDCLPVAYEDIVPPGSLAPVLRFLEVEPGVALTVASRRQSTATSTADRFTNPRWAALGSRIADALAGLIARLGATALVCRRTTY